MSIFFSKNFKYSEIMCPCGCGKAKPIDPKLIYLLQALRDKIDKPIYISKGGGIRCKRYNKSIKGFVDSPHMAGKAVDIHAKKMHIIDLALEAKEVGFSRIGLYPFSHFIHVDTVLPYPSASWVRTGKIPKEYKYKYFKSLVEAISFVEAIDENA